MAVAVPFCPVVSSQSPADGSRWIAKWHGIFDQAGCEHRFTNTTTKRRSIHLGLRTLLYKIGRLSLPWKAKLSIGWDDAMRAGFLNYISQLWQEATRWDDFVTSRAHSYPRESRMQSKAKLKMPKLRSWRQAADGPDLRFVPSQRQTARREFSTYGNHLAFIAWTVKSI